MTTQQYQYIKSIRWKILIIPSMLIHRIRVIMDITKMDCKTAHKNILLGELEIKSMSNLKSDVWNTFGIVSDSQGNEFPFAACKTCNTVLAYKKGKTGTSTMKKHKCSLPTNQPLLTKTAVRMLPSKKPSSSKKMKDMVTAACVDFCSEDLRPFDSVARKGFLDLMQVVSVAITFFILTVSFILAEQM